MANLKEFSKKNNVRIKLCDTIFSQGFGFMFSSADKILIFQFEKEKNHSIHMLFVFFPIDINFISEIYFTFGYFYSVNKFIMNHK